MTLAKNFQITVSNELFQSYDVLKQKDVYIAGYLVQKWELAGQSKENVE